MYSNAINTRKKIREAMFQLLQNGKSLQDISITDLVKSANISRGSFYNHYNNVMEVADEVEDELMDNLNNIVASHKGNLDIKTVIKGIFDYLKENEDHYRAIVPVIPKYILEDLKEKFLKTFMNNTFSHLNSTTKGIVTMMFITNGLSVTYLDYLENKIDINLDELCNIYTSIITNLLNNIIL